MLKLIYHLIYHAYYLLLRSLHYIIVAQLLCQTYINENKWSMWDVDEDALHYTAKYHATQLASIVHVRRHPNIER